jgi:hypothetical protein
MHLAANFAAKNRARAGFAGLTSGCPPVYADCIETTCFSAILLTSSIFPYLVKAQPAAFPIGIKGIEHTEAAVLCQLHQL